MHSYGDPTKSNMNKSNKLTNIHNIVDWGKGENYPFGGCISYLMECMGEDKAVYDYCFFAGIVGDIFTMCYGNNGFYNDCVSVCADDPAVIKQVFSEIGYDCSYITRNEFNVNKDRYIDKVKEYIDKGIPVIIRDPAENANFNVIYSYDENGKILSSFLTNSKDYDMTNETDKDWIFIGDKQYSPDIADVMRKAVMRIPEWINMPKNKNNVYFGSEAMKAFADDIENGRYDKCEEDKFDSWSEYNIYICNIATNSGSSCNFLQDKCYVLNPDMTFIPEVVSLYRKTGDIWNKLEEAEASFNIKLETLKDLSKRKVIADMMRKLGSIYQKIAETIKNYK